MLVGLRSLERRAGLALVTLGGIPGREMPQRLAAKITGVTGYVPPKVLTNADLEKMVETNDEWIRDRTGIRERRIVEQGVAASDLATEAAKQLLAQRNVRA